MDAKLDRAAKYLDKAFDRIREVYVNTQNIEVAAAQVQADLVYVERTSGQHRERCLAAYLVLVRVPVHG